MRPWAYFTGMGLGVAIILLGILVFGSGAVAFAGAALLAGAITGYKSNY